MSYTKRNLDELKDYRSGEIGETRFATRALDAEQTGLALFRLNPRKRQPFSHTHKEAEEVYLVLSGGGRLKLDDEVLEIGPRDAIRIAPAVERGIEAGDDGLEFIVFGPHRPDDHQINRDPGFWG